MEQLIIFFIFICLGYFYGIGNEKRHYESIIKREKEFSRISLTNSKTIPLVENEIKDQKLVLGSTVVSIDFFKLVLANIATIFGGRIKSYETLVDRARREAVLRMKESGANFDMIINLKIETSTISRGTHKKGVGSVEVLAYGTAIKV